LLDDVAIQERKVKLGKKAGASDSEYENCQREAD
jgi:hypothetical protein